MGGMRAVLVVLLLSGCGASGLGIANGTALGISTAALACDWAQTRSFAEIGWQSRIDALRVQPYHEANPIMGETPSPGAVDAYFLGALALNAAAWFLVPRRWRMAIPIAVTLVQAGAISNTLDRSGHDPGLCASGEMLDH